MSETPGPGANVARLRKARGLSQTALARRADVSLSLLTKIETGQRALTQGTAATLARAMGVTLDELLGVARAADETRVRELTATIRRFDIPGEAPPVQEVARLLGDVVARRSAADLAGVLDRLPALVAATQSRAHHTERPEDWAAVASAYSTVYWLAARHRWMTLADLAVMRQRVAAELSGPLAVAIAARDEAGTFLNTGDFDGGLTVVDRAVVAAASIRDEHERAQSLNALHLRGLTLAGRIKDRREAERHRAAALRTAEQFDVDEDIDGISVGPANTLTHVVATDVDMENYRAAIDAAPGAVDPASGLPATRIAPTHMNVARAHLALHDRDRALDSLQDAWAAAPQMARVHPTSQELLRVLISLHRYSNPALTRLARRADVGM
ncbi:helix-turn-helix transcriptional regulator [Streptomyces sp. NPDC051976]|uniref:helix-turn-helix domain-containing protein n=1 Tax=Streptomyces sp. NPDC051976 TaxID=3154947 RepID=UPI003433B652